MNRNMNSITNIYIDQENGDYWYAGISPEKGDFGPVKTIEQALNRLADMRNLNMMQPVTIDIMNDEYFLENSINIEKKLSFVTFRGYNGKKVKFRGGRKIENFTETEFNGVKCLGARLEDGIIPSDLFVNGKRAMLTRYPEEGYAHPLKVESTTPEVRDSTTWFIADKKDYDMFENTDGIVLRFNHFWVDESSPIESFDRESGKVTLERATAFTTYSENYGTTIGGNARLSEMEYWLENVPEMFKKPGQWYFDKKSNMLYYIPKENETEISAFIPVIDRMFDIYADNVNFENIIFENTSSKYESKEIDEKSGKLCASDYQSVSGAWGVINYYGVKGSYIRNCEFSGYGLYGVMIAEGCHNITISENVFRDCGAGGIKIIGSNDADETTNHTYGNIIEDNLITGCGMVHEAGCGVLVIHSYENKIRHNEICYTYYTGISMGWAWGGYDHSNTHSNLVEKNYIHHIGQAHLSDMGGVYTLGMQPGTFIRGNLIHDVVGRSYGGQALYPDEGTSYVTYENNICYNCGSASVDQHFGFMNVFRNNIFSSGDKGCFKQWRQEMHTGMVAYKNLFVPDGGDVYGASGEDVLVSCFTSDNNFVYEKSGKAVFYTQKGEKKYHEDAISEHGLDENTIEIDPKFADYEKRILADDSPIYKLGFNKIDMSDVGRRVKFGKR